MAQKFFNDADRRNVRWFWRTYLKQRTPWLLFIILLVLLQGVVYQQFLSITENGLRVIFSNGKLADLIQICIMVVILFAVRATASYVVPRLSTYLAADAVWKMRRDLTVSVTQLDQAYFDKTSPSDLILRLVNQAQELSNFVGQTTVNAVRDLSTILIVSGYLIYKSVYLFAVALIVLPIIFILLQWVSSHIKVLRRKAEAALGAYMSNIDEMAGGMRTIKMTGQESAEVDRMLGSSETIKSLTIRQQAAEAIVAPTIDVATAFVYVLVIGGGGYMALSPNYDMDGASIIAFMLGLALILDPARKFSQFFTKLQAGLILLDSIYELISAKATITDSDQATPLLDDVVSIQMENVQFSYGGENPLFSDISLSFKAGQKTAIVGATGSGKTTVLSLISRLYEAEAGSIHLNDRDIQSITLASLREKFSIVAQDIVIFNKSVMDNIRYARPEASDEEVIEAAKAARIYDVMLKRGDAPVGPKGSQLSGGQKQRIAIARAFLRPAPVLILDEATSALDQLTEAEVNASFARLQAGKTTIVVAHKLSSIIDADLIYVLEGGKLIEQGKHEELMKNKAYYYQIFHAQTGNS